MRIVTGEEENASMSYNLQGHFQLHAPGSGQAGSYVQPANTRETFLPAPGQSKC